MSVDEKDLKSTIDQLRIDNARLRIANEALLSAPGLNRNAATQELSRVIRNLSIIDTDEIKLHASMPEGHLDMRYPRNKYFLYNNVYDTLDLCARALLPRQWLSACDNIEDRIDGIRTIHSAMIASCQDFFFYADERTAAIKATYRNVQFPSEEQTEDAKLTQVLAGDFDDLSHSCKTVSLMSNNI